MIEVKIGDKFTLTYLKGINFKLARIEKTKPIIYHWNYIDDDGKETGKGFGNRLEDIQTGIKFKDWVKID